MSKKQVQDYVQDTRNDLGATLDEIEHRLSPAELTKSGIAWYRALMIETPWPGWWVELSPWSVWWLQFCGPSATTTKDLGAHIHDDAPSGGSLEHCGGIRERTAQLNRGRHSLQR